MIDLTTDTYSASYGSRDCLVTNYFCKRPTKSLGLKVNASACINGNALGKLASNAHIAVEERSVAEIWPAVLAIAASNLPQTLCGWAGRDGPGWAGAWPTHWG